MSARIDLVNFALSMLGEKAITSLEDDADEARVMKGFYYPARDGLLEEAEWTFATRRFKPPRNAVDPEWGWSAAYPIPSDILRVTAVEDNYVGQTGVSTDQQARRSIDHVIENRQILCNADPIFCKGIRRIDDEGIYSGLFFEAFATKLAALAALPITESNTKLQAMVQLHQSFLKTAKTRDGMQNTTRRLRNNYLSRAR